MRIVLAFYGTRGDVEPGIVLARELSNRGHDVCMAVPPDLIESLKPVGFTAVAYGPDTRSWLENTRDFWGYFFRNFWRVRDVRRFLRESREPGIRCWEEMSELLTSLVDGADLLISGVSYEELAINVAEYRSVPFATVLWFPIRVNGRLVPNVPPPIIRSAMKVYERLVWRGVKTVENAQRRKLGLPEAQGPVPRRIAEVKSLEIQAYDEVCFPGLASEWAEWGAQRPFVGALTLESPTDADAEVSTWIAAGTPPIFFGFGSIPVDSPAETLSMIATVCARLGQRALVCAGWSDFTGLSQFDHVKVVTEINYASVFPACRAVVHHGGAGTTAVSLRAGVPTLILWMTDVQVIWGLAIKRLKVGTLRRFSTATEDTLVTDLRRILAPRYLARAREISVKMASPVESGSLAADCVEDFIRARGVS